MLILLIFAVFLSVAYTILNKLFAVFFIYYICGFTEEFVALGSLASNALPCQLRPDCLSLCQIWCESIRYWASYCRLTDFKRPPTPRRILVHLNSHNNSTTLSTRPLFVPLYRIQCNMCNNGRVMAKNVIFNFAAAAILDFCTMWILTINLSALELSSQTFVPCTNGLLLLICFLSGFPCKWQYINVATFILLVNFLFWPCAVDKALSYHFVSYRGCNWHVVKHFDQDLLDLGLKLWQKFFNLSLMCLCLVKSDCWCRWYITSTMGGHHWNNSTYICRWLCIFHNYCICQVRQTVTL